MGKNKRLSKFEKQKRRTAEFLLATQGSRQIVSAIKATGEKIKEAIPGTKEDIYKNLPQQKIRRDVMFNFLFAILALILILILKKTGFGLSWFSSIFRL